uniref:Uncharacterized protein n=1 Tax=Oryza meridionalis TaxID=40149 RepID=A0A0E0EM88_9ORYZ
MGAPPFLLSQSLSPSLTSPLGQASRRVGMRSPTTDVRTRGSAATRATGSTAVAVTLRRLKMKTAEA